VIVGGETGSDTVLGFTLSDRNARGRIVRLGPALDTVLSAHDYPTAIRHLLAEALVLTALIGSLMKDDDAQMTMQVQANGTLIDLLVCDYRAGQVRGYVRYDPERLASRQTFPSLAEMFGDGYLAMTFDLGGAGQRYQGIVPLDGPSLSSACESYFTQSEQIPTLIRTSVRWDGKHNVAAGLLVQHLAEGEEGRTRLHVRLDHPEWQHVAVLAGTTSHNELVDEQLSLEAIVWRLFHEEREVRVERAAQITRGCRCSADYYSSVLSRFSENDRAEMRDEDGMIAVDCAFCSRVFKLPL
jgi:molecular chaperone Hsp33